jgi:hypothetical protein
VNLFEKIVDEVVNMTAVTGWADAKFQVSMADIAHGC